MAKSPLVSVALLTAIVAVAIGTAALVGGTGQAQQAVPYSPTNNELPAAVLGQAPPPQGQSINYLRELRRRRAGDPTS
jgi:hypothetical protein